MLSLRVQMIRRKLSCNFYNVWVSQVLPLIYQNQLPHLLLITPITAQSTIPITHYIRPNRLTHLDTPLSAHLLDSLIYPAYAAQQAHPAAAVTHQAQQATNLPSTVHQPGLGPTAPMLNPNNTTSIPFGVTGSTSSHISQPGSRNNLTSCFCRWNAS